MNPAEHPLDGSALMLEESVEELYEDAPVGYLSTARDGTILKANRTFYALTGYDAVALVGVKRFYDLLPPGAKLYYETHYAPLLQMQQDVRELALEIVRSDGQRVPVLVNAQLRDVAGEASLIRLTVFDASDRRQYERELLQARADAESRAAAASALQHVSEGVLLVDDDTAVVVLNPAASRILNVGAREAVGKRVGSLVPGWESVVSRIPVGRPHEPATSVVLPLAVAGDTRWVAASGEAAPDGIVYTLRDVTAERRLEDFRDDIVAIVSHELRTPLAGIYGAALTLEAHGDSLGEEQRRNLIKMIVEQSGRLSRILEEVLMTQRLDSGDLTIQRRTFDVREVLARVIQSSASWQSALPVHVAAADDGAAEGDPELFEQVLVNLLDNAMKYSPATGDVRVRIERHRSSIRVTVADDGPGVASEDEERIFQKFYRVDPGQANGVTGTGLGLYISREIVRRMHGRVGLLPAVRGATFFVDLPAAQ